MLDIRDLAQELTTLSWVEVSCSEVLIGWARSVVDPHAKVSMYRRGRSHGRQGSRLRDLVPVLRELQPARPAETAVRAVEKLGAVPEQFLRIGFHDHVLPELQRRYALAINECSWWSDAPAARLFTEGITNGTASLSAFADLRADIDIVAMSSNATPAVESLTQAWAAFGSERAWVSAD